MPNYSNLWEHGAYQRHSAIQVPLEKILRSHDLVLSAIGSDWLQQQTARLNLAHINVTDTHPLFSALTSPADTALVEICELADYLNEFKNEQAMRDIINDLKSDKYQAIVAELATAFRWKKAGAIVALHPQVPVGEADYSARIAGNDYTVEVSAFPHDELQESEFRLQMIVQDCVKSVLKREIPVVVKVTFSDTTAKMIENEIRQLATQSLVRFLDNPTNVIKEKNPYCEISIERIGPDSEQNPFRTDEYERVVDAHEHGWTSFALDVSYPGRGSAPTIESFSESEKIEHGRLFFRFPRQQRDPYQRLKKKLKKEIRQLAHVENARVVVLDASGLADIVPLNQWSLFNEIAPIFRITPELAAVWVMIRKWTTAFRYRYYVNHFPNPDSVFQIPRSFMSAVSDYEFRVDFVGEKKFESRGFDADHVDFARRVARPKP
jgi:hypothetical protein